jgi:hypothetical protein
MLLFAGKIVQLVKLVDDAMMFDVFEPMPHTTHLPFPYTISFRTTLGPVRLDKSTVWVTHVTPLSVLTLMGASVPNSVALAEPTATMVVLLTANR